jgi:hypothetical protein
VTTLWPSAKTRSLLTQAQIYVIVIRFMCHSPQYIMCAGLDKWTKGCGLELACWHTLVWIVVKYGIIIGALT